MMVLGPPELSFVSSWVNPEKTGNGGSSWRWRVCYPIDMFMVFIPILSVYNDIVILPISENMNSGKTHTFFSWAAINAWVPPIYTNWTVVPPQFSYSNITGSPPPLAPHDSFHAWQDRHSGKLKSWVRPDFVVKVDDDSFVMLAELESRLRLELHAKPKFHHEPSAAFSSTSRMEISSMSNNLTITAEKSRYLHLLGPAGRSQDPLIYWGYLVTNRLHKFMAGELYALTWSLVDWVAKDPSIKGLTRGAEDKQTAKWMKLHPLASEIRWVSERCWIYDHPRSGTVYVAPLCVFTCAKIVNQVCSRVSIPVRGNSCETLYNGVFGYSSRRAN